MSAGGELIGRVHHEDCRETARRLVAAGVQVDCIVTSPPYPQGKNHRSAEQQVQRGQRAWDGVLATKAERAAMREFIREELGVDDPDPFTPPPGHVHGQPNAKGETGLSVRIAAPDWLNWFVSLSSDLRPALRENANYVVNVDSCCFPTRHRHWGVFSLPERMEAAGWCFADALLWVKPNGPPTSAETRFHHSWEFIFHFANGDRWETDLEAVRTEHAEGSLPRFGRGVAPPRDLSLRPWNNGGSQWATRGGGYPQAGPNPNGARPKDFFVCPVGGTRWDTLGGAHFAAMPLALAKWMLSWASKPGDLIWDPFCGAATTIAAVFELNREHPDLPPRRWLGSELTEEAFVIAQRRVQLYEQGWFEPELEPDREQRQLLFAEEAEP